MLNATKIAFQASLTIFAASFLGAPVLAEDHALLTADQPYRVQTDKLTPEIATPRTVQTPVSSKVIDQISQVKSELPNCHGMHSMVNGKRSSF